MTDDIEYVNQAQIDNIREVFDLQYLTDEDLETLIETYDLVEPNSVDLISIYKLCTNLPPSGWSHITREMEAQNFRPYKKTYSNQLCFLTALLLAAMPYLKAVRVGDQPWRYAWFVADSDQLKCFNNHPQKEIWLDKFECNKEYAIL